MRSVVLVSIALLLWTGCGSQRNTGAALVAGGAIAAGIGASAASSSQCTSFGCYPQKPHPAGAKIAVAGLAAAAAGYALMETSHQDRAPSPPSRATGATPSNWRLVRQDPVPPEPEPETESEEKRQ